MDPRRRIDIDERFQEETADSWLGGTKETMPMDMKMAILAQHKQTTQTKKTRRLHWSYRWVAAACLVMFISFSIEQFQTVNKINHLEQRLAQTDRSLPIVTKESGDLLIINTFFSWSDIRALSTGEGALELANPIFPAFFQSNYFGDEQIKMRIKNYLNDYQLAVKIN